jgi:hypothetical protein
MRNAFWGMSPVGVKGTYDRHTYQPEMLQAYERLAALIEAIVNPQPNVVPLHG